MKRFSLPTWLGIAAVLLVACAPTVPPAATPASTALPPTPTIVLTPTPELSPTIVPADASLTSEATQTARHIAADELSVAPDQVKVLAITPVDWPDASLGCPQPDMMYGQVITPGYQARVEVDGQVHDVHMDANGYGVICTTPQ